MNPSKYVSSNEVQQTNVRIAIREYAKDLKNISGKCMDIGCGPGDVTHNILLPFLGSNAVILATDISGTMIEYAKKTYGNNERLKFEIFDIETENLPKKYISTFDHIFSFNTLHWCSENSKRKVFANMYNMLQPGGTILVYFQAAHDIFNVYKNMAQDARFAPYMQNEKNFVSPFYNSDIPTQELKDLLESIGFNVQHCSLREIDFSNINTDTFLSSIMSVETFVETMPPNLKEEFKAELIREYKNYKIKLYSTKQCDNKEESILDVHKILIAYAQKNVQ